MFQIRQCQVESCRFRFPAPAGDHNLNCPACGAPTSLITAPFVPGSHPPVEPVRSRHFSAHPAQQPKNHEQPTVEALLDNIRSIFNVGAIFRTADGAGLRRLHLCGITATPNHPKVAKTALGAERATAWTHHNNALDAAKALKGQGMQLWALERRAGSQSLFAANPLHAGTPLVLVVGNELAGIDPQLLGICDRVLHLPMEGIKESLNVAIAFGIAAYHLRHGKFSPTRP